MQHSPKILVTAVMLAVVVSVAAPKTASANTLDELIAHVQSMMEEMAKVQIQLLELKKNGVTGGTSAATTGSVLGATTFKFTEDLSVGVTNDDIKKVQALLKTDPEIYPEGIVSGFYGPATTQAIRNLQGRFGLNQVGVIGPATTALLQRLISQQNADGTYPSDILDPARPTPSVLGASTSQTTTPNPTPVITVPVVTTSSNLKSIELSLDQGEAEVTVEYKNGDDENFIIFAEDEDEAVEKIAEKLDVSEAAVRAVLETDVADTIDEITAEIDSSDTVHVRVTYDNDDTDRFTVEEDNVDDIISAIADKLDINDSDVEDFLTLTFDLDLDEIDAIRVVVGKDDAEATVELENRNEYQFIIDETDENDIIDELAQRLDLDDNDVEDITDFDFANREVASITVEIENERAAVHVEFEKGEDKNFSMNEDSKSDMIEAIADKIGVTVDDVENVIDFEYLD